MRWQTITIVQCSKPYQHNNTPCQLLWKIVRPSHPRSLPQCYVVISTPEDIARPSTTVTQNNMRWQTFRIVQCSKFNQHNNTPCQLLWKIVRPSHPRSLPQCYVVIRTPEDIARPSITVTQNNMRWQTLTIVQCSKPNQHNNTPCQLLWKTVRPSHPRSLPQCYVVISFPEDIARSSITVTQNNMRWQTLTIVQCSKPNQHNNTPCQLP